MIINYILNKISHKKLEKTPYKLWKKMLCFRIYFYKYLKVWRCLAKIAVSDPKNINIELKIMDCIFIKYTYKIMHIDFSYTSQILKIYILI